MQQTQTSDSPQRPTPLRQFLGPRYWLSWLGAGVVWLTAHLPFKVQMGLGRLLGLLTYHLVKGRRRVCEVNLRLCLPQLSEAERQRLLRRNFTSYGISLVEIAAAWYRDPESYRGRVRVTGLENLERAQAGGKGVLLVGAHFTTLEMGGLLFSLFKPMDVTYRPNRNPLWQALMFNGRLRHYGKVIARDDVRSMIRSLKAGRILWYGPDQDYGPKHSVFAPFFGVPTATITTPARFARTAGAAVVFFSHYREPDNSGYHLNFSPPLQGYPSGDDEQDAARINQLIEEAVMKRPEQYMWLHKRFKTRPEGSEPRPY